jgi:carboxylesterase type B
LLLFALQTKVLLFGQSAGALDTFIQATLPNAAQLMSAAVMESGGGRDPPTIETVQTWQKNFVDGLNCSYSDVSRMVVLIVDLSFEFQY